VSAAEVTVAEAAVTDDALRCVFALLERAADFLGRHAAAQRESEVEG